MAKQVFEVKLLPEWIENGARKTCLAPVQPHSCGKAGDVVLRVGEWVRLPDADGKRIDEAKRFAEEVFAPRLDVEIRAYEIPDETTPIKSMHHRITKLTPEQVRELRDIPAADPKKTRQAAA